MNQPRLTLREPPRASAREPESPSDRAFGIDVVSLARMARGGRWRTEAMRSYERPVLYWFTRGQGRITIEGKVTGYRPFDLVYLPTGVMHGFSTSAQMLGSALFLDDLPRAPAWPDQPHHLRVREVQKQRELTAQIDSIASEIRDGRDHSDTAIRYHTGLLGVWFNRYLEEADSETRREPAAATLVRAYTALVDENFQKPIGVAEFARRLGVTPTHLTRSCRSVSGCTALSILHDRRHYEACRLLTETLLPVSRIASATGFASNAYFSRAFRAREGASPSTFRRVQTAKR